MFSLQTLLTAFLLLAMTGWGNNTFANQEGKGYGKHRRGGFSSSLKLTTTTGVVRAVAIQEYVDREIVAIQEESSRGQGPHLVALAQILEEPHPESFGQWMQIHYNVLFVEMENPQELLARIPTYRLSAPI